MLKRKNNNRTLVILIVLLLLVSITFLMMPGSSVPDKNQGMDGSWDFYFTYSNDTNLIYRGDLQIQVQDSIIADFAIIAPKSSRPENIRARDVKKTDHGFSGTLIYDRFKINGGYLTESFELQFKDDQTFDGTGRCQSNCAEGTENSSILWHGSKQDY